MLAVYGTLLLCGGTLFFFIMLHFHRRPDMRWTRARGVGNVIVFLSMTVIVMGIGLIGRHLTQPDTQSFGLLEGVAILAALAASYYVIRKTYLPPLDEDTPQPLELRGAGARMPGAAPTAVQPRAERPLA